jgi:tetratricopeptide (TPR) repeat protein/peroxiredoxin
LSRSEKPRLSISLDGHLDRREFLTRFSLGAGATFVPSRLWGLISSKDASEQNAPPAAVDYHLHPHYREQRPVDIALAKVAAGSDEFITEKYAAQLEDIMEVWSAELRRAPQATEAIARFLANDFSGASLLPKESRTLRSDSMLEIRRNTFADHGDLNREAFWREFRSRLHVFSKILTAEFQVTSIQAKGSDAAVAWASRSSSATAPILVQTRVRYEIVGTGAAFHREQWVGDWEILWTPSPSGEFRVKSWRALDETQARARSPIYQDITATALGSNSSYAAQMLHGSDYWRTILDGACGVDVYGHNGVSVADIDNDGFDDLYVCQPAGLPNRMYRNRGDGTFEDVTDTSGLGVLENTACALFADFNNDGRQDVIVVQTSGPLLFLNDGGGKFRLAPDAFHFATPPQGTFTGAAVADYDRDGWLDIYFCLYTYYQGTGQYKYPTPYHDAENGPPNFLMRNQRDGTFRDVTAETGQNQNNTRYSFCCAWSDYNRDGWPDLYVVNDFGRKNLYRNNGDGTFTDIAAQAGVEDVGAGMSVSWFECSASAQSHDRRERGDQDLYVANMWTAAGERVSTQEIFKKGSSNEIRALYQKHATGNSLLRERRTEIGTAFEEATNSSGAGTGRWAWSSDAFDFDHDGFSDLYVTNGMVSGPSRPHLGDDLNSFFWRQVVAKSPDDAQASKAYELGWNAINELIRSDGTWSGYERNICYANNRDGTFSDVSAAVGLDFVEDGRSFTLADIDHDGRLEIVLKNRNAPQLRVLKNVVGELPPAIAFRLEGAWGDDPQINLSSGSARNKSSRDAIGAEVTIETEGGRHTRTLRAGSGFLSQHSKDVFFGLGNAKGTVRASIRWPSGLVQDLGEVPANHRIWVAEGAAPMHVEPFRPIPKSSASTGDLRTAEVLPEKVETWLLSPFPAPDFSLPDFSGQKKFLSEFRGKKVLLSLWSADSASLNPDAKAFAENSARWAVQGLQPIVVFLPGDSAQPPGNFGQGSVLALRGSDDFAAIFNIVFRQLFDRHRDLALPTSFLIDANGDIVTVYQGPLDPAQVEHDFQHLPQTDSERLVLALPFVSPGHALSFGRNYLSYGSLFFQRGYLDEAKAAFELALRGDPASAEALYGIGSVYLNQNKNAEARETFERTVKLQANYPDTLPDAWNNLGVLATREGRIDDSVLHFKKALELNPHHLLSLDNLGNAYRLEKRWDESRQVLEHAIAVAPQDAEANYGLGMVYAQTGDNVKAYEYLQRALAARPDYPEALNNLGVLFLVTQRRNDAVASFEQCIRVAPAFDQAYLNLARVYALEGARDKARGVILDLLKQNPDHAQGKQMLEQLNQ